MLLIRSMSHFELGSYENALKDLKRLDSSVSFSHEDENFYQLYTEKVNELTLIYLS